MEVRSALNRRLYVSHVFVLTFRALSLRISFLNLDLQINEWKEFFSYADDFIHRLKFWTMCQRLNGKLVSPNLEIVRDEADTRRSWKGFRSSPISHIKSHRPSGSYSWNMSVQWGNWTRGLKSIMFCFKFYIRGRWRITQRELWQLDKGLKYVRPYYLRAQNLFLHRVVDVGQCTWRTKYSASSDHHSSLHFLFLATPPLLRGKMGFLASTYYAREVTPTSWWFACYQVVPVGALQ